jgi:cystathionine gamma-synthase
MSKKNSWQASTQAAQALGWIDEQTKAITPPMHPSSTFIRDADNQYRNGYSYARDTNPTYDQAEELLATLETGEDALLFSSGLAACAAVFQACRPGDRVIMGDVMYWGVKKWLDDIGEPWGLKVSYVRTGDLAALSGCLDEGPVKLVWIETPSNPMWSCWDIRATSVLCKDHGALLIVDNTVATPVITRPLELGADIVMHSATKYLNGHSDIIAGALVCKRNSEFWQNIRLNRSLSGAILGTFEAWLLLRGMRTLFLRVRESSNNALAIAQHFENHPAIGEVLYPGLASSPEHEIAKSQMDGFYSGMLSMRLVAGEAGAISAAANVAIWKRATSLGGVESLVEHRASVEGDGTLVPSDLLRFSCGIEAVDDLISDLEQAIGATKT